MTAELANLEAHRPAVLGHCYRMLGSAFDADDAVQETMIRAWRSFDQFDGRASIRTWLYRIATNVCLDELKNRGRRARPIGEGAPSSGAPSLEFLIQRPSAYWIEPIPDSRVLPEDADPSERAMLRQNVRLAFVAALQNLSPQATRCAAASWRFSGVRRLRSLKPSRHLRLCEQRPSEGAGDTRQTAEKASSEEPAEFWDRNEPCCSATFPRSRTTTLTLSPL